MLPSSGITSAKVINNDQIILEFKKISSTNSPESECKYQRFRNRRHTYTVKCSSHFGVVVLRTTSVLRGGWPSTISSRYGSGLVENNPPTCVSLADWTEDEKDTNVKITFTKL